MHQEHLIATRRWYIEQQAARYWSEFHRWRAEDIRADMVVPIIRRIGALNAV